MLSMCVCVCAHVHVPGSTGAVGNIISVYRILAFNDTAVQGQPDEGDRSNIGQVSWAYVSWYV